MRRVKRKIHQIRIWISRWIAKSEIRISNLNPDFPFKRNHGFKIFNLKGASQSEPCVFLYLFFVVFAPCMFSIIVPSGLKQSKRNKLTLFFFKLLGATFWKTLVNSSPESLSTTRNKQVGKETYSLGTIRTGSSTKNTSLQEK